MRIGIFGVLAGHWAVSAEHLGHDVVWTYEWHADSRLKKMSKFFKMNHRSIPLYGYESQVINKADELPVDMIVGSPPCIGISTGNPNSKAGHGANQGMIAFARAVQAYKPKAFIMEMVSNFKTAAKFKPLLKEYEELIGEGYDFIGPVLNLENYDSPTKRKRVFFIGFREDLGISPEVPYPSNWMTNPNWKDARTLFEEAGLDNPTEAEAVAAGRTHKWNPEWKGPFSCLLKYGIDYFRLPDKKPGKTMTAVGGVYIRHPDGHRAITKEEAKVLIGFDKDYNIPAGFSTVIRACAWGVPIMSLDNIVSQVVDQLNA
jgi:site-specific DNA-cytosine methylase